MSGQRNLIIGFDLSEDYSQICCFNYKTSEPESLSVAKDVYLIPTALGIKNYSKDWIYGDEAVKSHNKNTGVLIDGLLNRIENNIETEIFGNWFQPVILLEKFFRKCLLLLKKYYPNDSILKIVITMKEINQTLTSSVYGALRNLGLEKDRVMVQSHAQSYQYYALSQSKELWNNDVGLFDFDDKGLIYQQISINRHEKPHIVSIMEKDYSDTLKIDMLQTNTEGENLEYIFQNIARNALHRQVVSTIYATGKGFEGSWADNVLKELCVGRRVFKGQNLYAKGACYAARELTGQGTLSNFAILGKEMITATIMTQGYEQWKLTDIVLCDAFTPWYEVNHTMEFILDDIKEIPIIIKDAKTREKKSYVLPLNDLPERPNRTTRLELNIQFESSSTAILTVKDKGFGNFYPSTNKTWVEKFEIK